MRNKAGTAAAFLKKRHVVALVSCVFTLAMVYHGRFDNNQQFHCRENFQTKQTECRPICPRGFFGLPGMKECHPWLNCADIKNNVKSLIRIGTGKGYVKKIELATWKHHRVTQNTLSWKTSPMWKNYFFRGLDNFRNMQPSIKVNQLLGFCGYTFVSEYHPLGSADNFQKLLQSADFEKQNNTRTRLATCISYVEAINFLHNSPIGTRILCDTYTVERTLRQLLLTVDFDVILNDIDEIPEVKRSAGLLTRCNGELSTFYPFIAPEQRNGEGVYDEKADIWKIPNICDFFLGSSKDIIADKLNLINTKCKSKNATLRPSAAEVSKVYRSVLGSIPFNEIDLPEKTNQSNHFEISMKL